ncbi:glucose-6-phosphate dehydrogenase [Microbacterium terricola]|uniref:Glucose-6-phosphate dehydrogenase n=1 Tax=Microbacterium terricola TaxID=344163 RepID=A0ABM8E148_9MICO|nr:glucose-6-phosphate dehydrogenase [Microbacterium terricola]UYK40602.1 glucose-6-phosphate dehydrogenase [Microbacterium terricola]BDV31668.1 hypothetical protein Microterr_23280 [Microbacterium terricola]
MKFRSSSDWREALAFETPMLASEIVPGDPCRCVGCAATTAPFERTDLWAVKHRHPNDPAGFVRFYCVAHRPVPASAAVAPVGRRETARLERAHVVAQALAGRNQ